MKCRACGQDRFTLRGVCDTCAPDMHAAHGAAADAVQAMIKRFHVETGKVALGHWEEFEAFVLRQPDAADYAAALERSARAKDEAMAVTR